jgi:hypothetical protein
MIMTRRSLLLAVLTYGSIVSTAAGQPAQLDVVPERKATCSTGATRLCLQSNRFRVTLSWRDFAGNTGSGQAVRLTEDTGYFWFFNAENVEVMVKILDGRGLNGHFWLFAGSLSNVQYTIFVTDLTTGASKTYVNPSGTLASLADTRAFPPDQAASLATTGSVPMVHRAASAGLAGVNVGWSAVRPTEGWTKAGSCTADATSLCLNDSRFRISVNWRDFSGTTGVGRGVPLTTDTGYFWFFGPSNVELVIKVLDGRPVNGQFWIFFGALSTVEYDIIVTDTETGQSKIYSNPSGRLASVADTAGFIGDSGPFVSGLSLQPGTIFAAEPAVVTFSAALRSDVNRPAVIEVHRAPGGETILALYDDGDLAKGDDIAGDGLYNNRLTLLPGSETDQRYFAAIPASGSRTPDQRLVVVGRLNASDFSRNVNLSSSLETLYRQAVDGGTSPQQAASMVLAQLAGRPNEVRIYGKSSSSDGVWWVSKEGVLNAIVPSAVGAAQERSSAPAATGASGSSRVTAEGALWPSIQLHPAAGSSTGAGLRSGDALTPKAGENEIGSSLAVVLAPFFWQFEGQWHSDESDEIANLLRNNGFVVTEKRNASSGTESISIEDFKSLASYGAVVMTSHGDNFYDGLLTLWIATFGEDIPFWVGGDATQVVVDTGVHATESNRATYEKDLKAQRLVLAGNRYAITPSFISYYNGTFPNSVIYVGSCRSTFNSSLAQAFIAKGTGAYFGYSDYVDSGFASSHGLSLFSQLVVDGRTTGEIVGVGDSETDADPARFDRIGATDLSWVNGLRNGDFEIGNLTGWLQEGDTRIVTSLGPLAPPQGIYMAIISTGLGSVSDSQSRIFQQFRVPQNATSLTFRYNVVSEEPLEFVGTAFDDQFEVNVKRGSVVERIAAERVNASAWSPITGIDFDGGDSTVYQTGWRNVTYNVQGLRGQLITLEVRVFDVGDSIYDTAAVIDNFKVQ